jgi:hypothetical protein
MGLGSDVSIALRRERLHAADACFSADIAKLIDFIIAVRSTAGFRVSVFKSFGTI